jgi:hypothetical protein
MSKPAPRSRVLFGVVCVLAFPGASAALTAVLTVLGAPGLKWLSWTLFTGLASPPFTVAGWLVFVWCSRRFSTGQAAAALVACVAALAGSLMAWGAMGLFMPGW